MQFQSLTSYIQETSRLQSSLSMKKIFFLHILKSYLFKTRLAYEPNHDDRLLLSITSPSLIVSFKYQPVNSGNSVQSQPVNSNSVYTLLKLNNSPKDCRRSPKNAFACVNCATGWFKIPQAFLKPKVRATFIIYVLARCSGPSQWRLPHPLAYCLGSPHPRTFL